MNSGARRPRWLGLVIKNGPAVVTIIGSAVIALLSAIFKFTTEQFLQAILLLLVLLGTSLLVDQLLNGRESAKKLRDIDGSINRLSDQLGISEADGLDRFVLSRRDLEPLESRLAGAREVFISGGSLYRLVNEYKSLFEKLAIGGCKFRLLMVDPECAAAEHLGTHISYEANSLDGYRSSGRDAINGLKSLQVRHPSSFEVRTSNVVPPFSLILVRATKPPASVQVELYPFGLPARDRPMFRLDETRDPKLFQLFADQAERLWGLPGNEAL